jgi:hypothetical protein
MLRNDGAVADVAADLMVFRLQPLLRCSTKGTAPGGPDSMPNSPEFFSGFKFGLETQKTKDRAAGEHH